MIRRAVSAGIARMRIYYEGAVHGSRAATTLNQLPRKKKAMDKEPALTSERRQGEKANNLRRTMGLINKKRSQC